MLVFLVLQLNCGQLGSRASVAKPTGGALGEVNGVEFELGSAWIEIGAKSYFLNFSNKKIDSPCTWNNAAVPNFILFKTELSRIEPLQTVSQSIWDIRHSGENGIQSSDQGLGELIFREVDATFALINVTIKTRQGGLIKGKIPFMICGEI